MYQLPAFKGASRQGGYDIGCILKRLRRTFVLVVKKSLLSMGKQVLQSGVQVLDEISRGEDGKVAIKRRAVEEAKKMGKRRINRAPTRKTPPVVSKLSQGANLLQLRRKEYQRIFCK